MSIIDQDAPAKLGLGTRAVHSAQEIADPTTNARAVPIYATTSYVFNGPDHAASQPREGRWEWESGKNPNRAPVADSGDGKILGRMANAS